MKKSLLTMILIVGQTSFARITCKSPGEKITIDPHGKVVQVYKGGKLHNLQIVSQNQHAYKLFGESTYELDNGYILGVKSVKPSSKKKRMTVFRNGAPIISVSDCHGT